MDIIINYRTLYRAPLVSDIYGTLVASSYDGARIVIQNVSGKTMKYITIKMLAYNSFKDAVPVANGAQMYSHKAIGPVNPGAPATIETGGVWPAGQAENIAFERIDVEYTDGSTYTWNWYDGEDKLHDQTKNDGGLWIACKIWAIFFILLLLFYCLY